MISCPFNKILISKFIDNYGNISKKINDQIIQTKDNDLLKTKLPIDIERGKLLYRVAYCEMKELEIKMNSESDNATKSSMKVQIARYQSQLDNESKQILRYMEDLENLSTVEKQVDTRSNSISTGLDKSSTISQSGTANNKNIIKNQTQSDKIQNNDNQSIGKSESSTNNLNHKTLESKPSNILNKFKEESDKSNIPLNTSFTFFNVGENDNIYSALKSILSNKQSDNYSILVMEREELKWTNIEGITKMEDFKGFQLAALIGSAPIGPYGSHTFIHNCNEGEVNTGWYNMLFAKYDTDINKMQEAIRWTAYYTKSNNLKALIASGKDINWNDIYKGLNMISGNLEAYLSRIILYGKDKNGITSAVFYFDPITKRLIGICVNSLNSIYSGLIEGLKQKFTEHLMNNGVRIGDIEIIVAAQMRIRIIGNVIRIVC